MDFNTVTAAELIEILKSCSDITNTPLMSCTWSLPMTRGIAMVSMSMKPCILSTVWWCPWSLKNNVKIICNPLLE